MNSEDKRVGRSTSSIGVPDEIRSNFRGVSSLSLAVAEWIIGPRRVRVVAVLCYVPGVKLICSNPSTYPRYLRPLIDNERIRYRAHIQVLIGL